MSTEDAFLKYAKSLEEAEKKRREIAEAFKRNKEMEAAKELEIQRKKEEAARRREAEEAGGNLEQSPRG